MKLSLIVAADLDDCIGQDDDIPWYIRSDLIHFRELTTSHVCIAGSRTQASIVARLGKPLPNRFTVVITRSAITDTESVMFIDSPRTAAMTATTIETFRKRNSDNKPEVFVIGGAKIYQELLFMVDKIYLTRVEAQVNGNIHMPEYWLGPYEKISDSGTLQEQSDEYPYSFQTYVKR